MLAIAQELGARDGAPAPEVVQRVSEVLNRVHGMVGLMVPNSMPFEESGAQTLLSYFQPIVAPALRHEAMPADLLDAMPGMFKPAAPLSSSAVGDIAIRIPANRLRLSQVVLSSAVPAGGWSEVDMDRFPSPGMALSHSIGNRQPVICQVTIKGPNAKAKAAAARLAVGSQEPMDDAILRARMTSPLARQLAAGTSRWVALPEIVALSRLIDIVPKRIFIAGDLVSPQASLVIPPPVFSPAAAASISAGLFAELYLHAVSSAAALNQVERGMPTPQVFTVRAAWLASVARSYMLQEALALAQSNFNVTYVGQSHLTVSINRRALRNLRKHVAASKLLSYPTGLKYLEQAAFHAREIHEVPLGGQQ
ncbi:hypothetical protein [Paucibacter soli]|uniref:hypothetical protein n=1 Tax=Paucibacter soli TaxID=3133433 RepID=UPI003098AAD1